MAKKWIQGAIKHPGALHRQLGVKEGEKIPAKKMAAARAGKYGPTAEKRAHLAKTLGSFEHGGMIPETGVYKMHEGEMVIPSPNHEPNMAAGKQRDMSGNNCCVLGDGSGSGDHDHVMKMTPMETKKKQILSAREAGLDPVREKATTKARREEGSARPLDGGVARK